MVAKLVNIPPDQRSVTYGMPMAATRSATMDLACFLVATKRIFFPLLAICFIADAASSSLTPVLCRSMMWMPFFSVKM